MGAILGQKGPSALCPLSPRDLLGSGLYGGLEVSHSSLVATPSRGPTPTRASQPAREELPLAFARPGPTWASPNHARNGKESPVALSVAPPQPQALSPTSGHPPRWPGQAPTTTAKGAGRGRAGPRVSRPARPDQKPPEASGSLWRPRGASGGPLMPLSTPPCL